MQLHIEYEVLVVCVLFFGVGDSTTLRRRGFTAEDKQRWDGPAIVVSETDPLPIGCRSIANAAVLVTPGSKLDSPIDRLPVAIYVCLVQLVDVNRIA